MKRNMFRSWAVGLLVCLATAPLMAQGPPAAAPAASPAAPQDQGWPRVYKAEGHEIVIHQPQVDRWQDYRRIEIRAAVVIRKEGASDSQYGAVRATAETAVNHEARTVLIGPRKFEEIRFPGAKADEAERLKKMLLAALPDEQPITIALDRVLAAVAQGDAQKGKEVNVSLDPPPIYASDKPAVLVIFAGKPKFEKAGETGLMFAANTNWDIFLDVATLTYYLLNGDQWLSTSDVLKGPWAAAKSLPAALSKLPGNENWQDVRQNIPGKQGGPAPVVFTATGPAELILTEGAPQLEPIPGTKLLLVGNTESDLFMHMTEQQFYFLTAGRWFRAKALAGPWSAATKDLPADFAAIPEDSEAAEVLASVPGTPQAQEAVIQASVPRTATVKRSEVTVNVTYQGDPKFVVIQDTTVKYAANSPYKVFLVDGKYYCCHEGVWFIAAVNKGPWAVCTLVPAAIYTIPATHPTHNVTYVYVYDSTPDTVVVGSTAGYSGQYVANGLLMFGAGVIVGAILADDDNCWNYHYHSSYFSYGCGAHYSHYHGGYYGGHHRSYGPYGGAGAWSAYNPATGVYSRGAYRYGPAGSASARSAYNPWTGNYAARANVNTPYGSWGRSVVSNGDDWVKAGHRSGPRGTAGGVVTSEGTGVVAGKGRHGEGAAVAKDKDGDLYVGRDGEVYKRDDGGGWAKREDGEWKKPEGNPQTPRAQSTNAAGQRQPRTGEPTQTSERPANSGRTGETGGSSAGRPEQASATNQDLDRQGKSRDRGSASAERASRQRSSPPARTRSSSGRSGGGGRGR